MDAKAMEFAKKERICVLTTVLPSGTPHSASLHFSASDNLDTFVFVTERASRKCSHFEMGKSYPAALTAGFSEEEFKEIQMEGGVTFAEGEDLDKCWQIYDAKFPGSSADKNDKKWILMKFVPDWWRYTEFKPKFYKAESE